MSKVSFETKDAQKLNDLLHLKHSNQGSVNLRPPFCIFFNKIADLAARLHPSFARDLPQGRNCSFFTGNSQIVY